MTNGEKKNYSILLTTVFKFSSITRKEKLEMKNKILGCGFGKKKCGFGAFPVNSQ